MNADRLSQLEIEHARLSTSVEHLSESVRELTKTVQDLRDTMNKGRGALGVIIAASSVGGAALATWLSSLFGKS